MEVDKEESRGEELIETHTGLANLFRVCFSTNGSLNPLLLTRSDYYFYISHLLAHLNVKFLEFAFMVSDLVK